MADTKQVTGPVKPFYDDAQNAIDEQAILDKYNAATMAQFAAQREQNRQNENKFYNEMYNTQKTAMDTIRQSNAAAVSNGASRGVQAANELSALLGLEQESVASATELAQANRQTAQEETAAVLENVLKAYQDAAQQRSDLTMQGIQAASLDASNEQASAATKGADTENRKARQQAAETGTTNYLSYLADEGVDYSQEYSAAGYTALELGIQSSRGKGEGQGYEESILQDSDFAGEWDRAWGAGSSTAATKVNNYEAKMYTLSDAFGLDLRNDQEYQNNLIALKALTQGTNGSESIGAGVRGAALVGSVLGPLGAMVGALVGNVANQKSEAELKNIAQNLINNMEQYMLQKYKSKTQTTKE